LHPRQSAIFLDRDDTLIDTRCATASTPTPGDLFDPALVGLLPGVLESCRRLRGAGYRLVVVSNQGALAAGLATLSDVERTNDRVRALLVDHSGDPLIDAVYFAPARPGGPITRFNQSPSWRKPEPGMILAARDELGIDLQGSWLLGDSERDVLAGVAAGIARARCLLVGGTEFPTLTEATAWVLGGARARGSIGPGV
jgi:D-glycero-D-manno-heptose 1,7-bisphosphate phosphatase